MLRFANVQMCKYENVQMGNAMSAMYALYGGDVWNVAFYTKHQAKKNFLIIHENSCLNHEFFKH